VCAVMVNVVGAQHGASELLQQAILFVGGTVGADYTNGLSAFAVADLAQTFARMINGFFPGDRDELAVFAHQRLPEPGGMIKKVKAVAAFDAEKITVDSALVAIVTT